jgi:molybdopterin converting factor subunit 1
MILHVRLFARAKDLAGAPVIDVELADPATVGDLRAALRSKYPRLAGIVERSMLAVNAEFAAPAQRLNAQDEIALLPPVSGG